MIKILSVIKDKFQNKKKNIAKNTEEDLISYDVKRNSIENVRQQFGPSTLIETGTFLGDTINHFKSSFDQIFSIELSSDLAKRASERFSDNENIEILQGNSKDIMPLILKKLTCPALCWLDGHYSSEFFLNGEYFITARGDKNTPVESELDILLNDRFQHIILIDDARLFNGTSDYPTLNQVEKKVLDSLKSYNFFVENDIIHIIPAIIL